VVPICIGKPREARPGSIKKSTTPQHRRPESLSNDRSADADADADADAVPTLTAQSN
jgi:hypothetical protein